MSDLGISAPGNEPDKAGGGENAFNYEQAYAELRPNFTRATQQLSEAEQRLSDYEAFLQALSDPETQRDALASLGFEMDNGVTQAEVDELADPLEAEVTQLRETVERLQKRDELEAATREEQQTLDARDNYIGEYISYIETENQVKFDEHDEEVLGNLAIAMAGEDGVPDVQGAYNALLGESGLVERHRSQWIDTKVGAFRAPWGTSIPADKRPETRAERVDFVDRRLQEMDQLQ